jgi:hypothetical protein
MQVTSLFAIFFAFLTLVAPLATYAVKITVPTNITTGNVTITCTTEETDPGGALTLFLVRNTTRETLIQGVYAELGAVTVNIPANATGDGWTIQATLSDNVTNQVGLSLPFFIASPPQNSGMSNAGPVIGGVVAGVLTIALLVLVGFLYMRRRRKSFTGPEFNLEAAFPPPSHQRSFSSTASSAFADMNNKSIEMEKIEWETQLEEQFSRARAATPVSRGASPMLNGNSPRIPGLPLAPQRAARRNPSY